MAKWIKFAECPPNRKTKRWVVLTLDGSPIGEVSWYGPWRKYCFFPGIDTVYEQVCLRDIADFCEAQSLEHKRLRVSA